MDPRGELLLDELATHPQTDFDFPYWRERFQTLFKERLDDASREALLSAYAAILNMVERSLVASGRDTAPFAAARKTDWNTLCIQESLHRSGKDLFYPDDLDEIVQREIAAGRMDESSFSELAASGATVLGSGHREGERKPGFFKRLLAKRPR